MMNKYFIFSLVAVILVVGTIGAMLGYFNRHAKLLSNNLKAEEVVVGEELPEHEKVMCGITASVPEGPYYVSDTPVLPDGNLNYTNLPGDPIEISGYVYAGEDTFKPIANATIDIWQADAAGNYHPNADGSFSSYSPDEIALRGTVVTDEDGSYRFKTIYPGEYGGRARHIHVKVRAEGFSELTTQLILALESDRVSFSDDAISKELPNCHLVSLGAADPPATATFDFHLEE